MKAYDSTIGSSRLRRNELNSPDKSFVNPAIPHAPTNLTDKGISNSAVVPSPYKAAAQCSMNPTTVQDSTAKQSALDAYTAIQNECSAMDESALSACSIPNVVHLVWLPGGGLQFRHYLSLKSIHDRLRPDAIYMHGFDFPISDPIFQRFITEFNVITVLSREVTHVHSEPVDLVEHKSDVIRLESLLRFGGMYFDLDVYVLKPLTVFMNDETVMPMENNNGIILAKRCSRFLRRWYEEYKSFDDGNWALHSIRVPKTLFNADPTGITASHKELRSDWTHTADMFISDDTAPAFWGPLLSIHSLMRAHSEFKELDEAEVVALDNNYGRIARNILAGKEGFP